AIGAAGGVATPQISRNGVLLFMSIPARVAERLSTGLKRFAPILSAAKARDVNESDTSMIVTDMLADIFGYDKYSEVTRELAIRGTYCDLATRIDGKFQMLIEVKAIGLELKDAHAKQAIDYAANLGVEWVALSNGHLWKVFRVVFAKPIDQELVLDIDLLALNAKNENDLESLYLLTRESMLKSGLYAYHDHLQATNKFYLAAVVLSDTVLDSIRRELRRVSDAKVELDELREALKSEVIKREVIEGDKADGARKKVAKAAGKMLRIRKEKEEAVAGAGPASAPAIVPAGPAVTE
ncbi:MAG TPA: type I restriction enzyme HsdR N-terminal domain-containing protein, partial [Thermoanaerobaculia bacterium]|nr:type I restriction enzyme HsdR N-terminal domain-containing protein [Thermoanaerobaculia bacterium]